MSQLTLDEVARRAEAGRDLGVRRRPSNHVLREVRPTIGESFERFHKRNPQVYELLVRLTRKVKARGKSTYGMKAIFEAARWHHHIERGDDDFMLNNNFTAHYSRLIEAQEEDLSGFFTKRRMRSE